MPNPFRRKKSLSSTQNSEDSQKVAGATSPPAEKEVDGPPPKEEVSSSHSGHSMDDTAHSGHSMDDSSDSLQKNVNQRVLLAKQSNDSAAFPSHLSSLDSPQINHLVDSITTLHPLAGSSRERQELCRIALGTDGTSEADQTWAKNLPKTVAYCQKSAVSTIPENEEVTTEIKANFALSTSDAKLLTSSLKETREKRRAMKVRDVVEL